MADNVLGLLFEISADPTKAIGALTQFRTATQREVDAVADQLLRLQRSSLEARATLSDAFSEMTASVAGFGAQGFQLITSVTESLLAQIQVEKLSALEHTKAENLKALASVEAIKRVAIVRAAEEIAEGISALARWEFRAAALHFASAAKFGVVAAAELGAFGGAGLGGGGRHHTAASPAGRTNARGGARVGTPEASAGPVGGGTKIETLQVQTLVVTNLAVSNLIDGMNTLVIQQDKFLMATRSRQAPIPGT